MLDGEFIVIKEFVRLLLDPSIAAGRCFWLFHCIAKR